MNDDFGNEAVDVLEQLGIGARRINSIMSGKSFEIVWIAGRWLLETPEKHRSVMTAQIVGLHSYLLDPSHETVVKTVKDNPDFPALPEQIIAQGVAPDFLSAAAAISKAYQARRRKPKR